MASLFRRALKAVGLLPTHSGPLVYALPVVSFSPRRGSRAVLAAYRENGWLGAVVDTVADAVATPRWKAYKRVAHGDAKRWHGDPRWRSTVKAERRRALEEGTEAGELVELPAHEILRLLESPHPEFPGRELRKLAQLHLDLVGEAFLWLRLGENGRPVGWEAVPPHCVLQTPQPGAPFFAVSYGLFHGHVAAAHMLWLKHLDPENPLGRGTGRGMALGDQLDTMEAIDRAAKATFERGGIPAAVVGVDSKRDSFEGEEAAEDLEKRFKEEHKGPENAGKVWFAPGGVSLAQIAVNYRELQADELAKGLRSYVRQTYNVPPELLGDTASSNRSTSEAAKYHLAEYAVAPRLEFLLSWFQHRLVPLVDADVILDYEDPRPQEWERVFRAMTTPITPAFTQNEARELAGRQALPELEGVLGPTLPGQGGGGNTVESAAANATPEPPRDRTGEEGRV
ncbi:phage portal protein [Myxococcus llanfairpwllgwyngyllgogerychwyrndrobwllllantysiliogogogochensis]|uniref:Phage portal protein n=2 Tax=Myxococcus llanfairpwllgwyngyllgogerychwyrndrobwllllantysiliogogogochensis TaxID=2590453 RepID=A0A540WYX9_9BACT|nr:phage portal protein [Myxococcus llanfairpwllgwyngyllgogerychwyrndrobwllllantysiliogogogochensis]